MEIAIMTSLFAKRDMNINAAQQDYDLMNIFTNPFSVWETGGG